MWTASEPPGSVRRSLALIDARSAQREWNMAYVVQSSRRISLESRSAGSGSCTVRINPPGAKREGFLFWLPWLNHGVNSIYLTQDAEGPLHRGLLLVSCGTIRVGELSAPGSPLLDTELNSTGLPESTDICPPSPLDGLTP